MHERPEVWSAANDEAGVADLVSRLLSLRPDLVVPEATGGFETLAAAAVAAVQIPAVVVNPRQFRDFAKSTGQLQVARRAVERELASAELVDPAEPPLEEKTIDGRTYRSNLEIVKGLRVEWSRNGNRRRWSFR